MTPQYPGGSQFGARWNHIGRVAEYSLSFYDGHNNLPLFRYQLEPQAALTVDVQRFFPQMRMYGGDAAIPLKAVTFKAEAAYFTSATKQADEYGLFVLQVERQAGEWFFIGGYAGQVVTEQRPGLDFAPDRGLAQRVSGPRGLYDRYQSQRGTGNRGAAERPRSLDEARILTGVRRSTGGRRRVTR